MSFIFLIDDMKKLLKRFISDQKIPIQPIDDKEYLDYALSIFGAKKQWADLCSLVEERFSGNEDLFLDYMQKLREKLISRVTMSRGYQNFQSEDMNKYGIQRVDGVRSDGIYKENLIGKDYTSIDLAEAGWQVLRKFGAGPDKSWKEFISEETDIDYFITSKQFREVVLGNLNPKRQKTVERWIINQVQEELVQYKDQLISQGDDEIIYTGDIELSKEYPNCHVSKFKLEGYKLKTGAKDITFYSKCGTDKTTYHCVPNSYYIPIIKLLRGEKIEEKDLLFINGEGILCKYLAEFKLEKL